ncbi:MAG: hypothetical protein NC038_07775 [Paludibacter sp.]|nr:hypothetical protein [Prevotella sp.]MCM1443641.1 hypothetical protein [Muribaculum sp.]MCM1482516.1 hypothetical protein [Paludibacter sp.]MCM1576892.1 hypothetical protein [Bacteroides sp.]
MKASNIELIHIMDEKLRKDILLLQMRKILFGLEDEERKVFTAIIDDLTEVIYTLKEIQEAEE